MLGFNRRSLPYMVEDASHTAFMTKPTLHRKMVAELSQKKQAVLFLKKKNQKNFCSFGPRPFQHP
jgi:hypothetical protein